jgi:hypothetical protein
MMVFATQARFAASMTFAVPPDMYPLLGLVADLPVDDLAALERSPKSVDVAGVNAGAAGDDDGCLGPEPLGQVASNESGATGDRGAGMPGPVVSLG